MIALFDINVLIARSDPGHEFHHRVRSWFQSQRQLELATCPLTENGFLRIYGHPLYPGGPGSAEKAARDLSVLRQRNDHRFLPDTISLLEVTTSLAGVGVSQITDLYLLALAVRHGAKFVTMDTRIPADLVFGGQEALVLIP